jgi:hypothetical protein
MDLIDDTFLAAGGTSADFVRIYNYQTQTMDKSFPMPTPGDYPKFVRKQTGLNFVFCLADSYNIYSWDISSADGTAATLATDFYQGASYGVHAFFVSDERTLGIAYLGTDETPRPRHRAFRFIDLKEEIKARYKTAEEINFGDDFVLQPPFPDDVITRLKISPNNKYLVVGGRMNNFTLRQHCSPGLQVQLPDTQCLDCVPLSSYLQNVGICSAQ